MNILITLMLVWMDWNSKTDPKQIKKGELMKFCPYKIVFFLL